MNCEQLAENFQHYFKIVYADTDSLLRQVYKIRYDVFCEELRLEENCPKDVERDDCDDYAHHFLLQHKDSGDFAGTVRYILPRPGRNEDIPMKQHCLASIDPELFDIDQLVPGTYGEVSRLAVPAQFRKRAGERGKPYIVEDGATAKRADEKRLFPYISIGLYLISAAFHIHSQLKNTFVMVEPRLARNMSRIGIEFNQIGQVIEYHGRRAPYRITQEQFCKSLKPGMRALYDHIYEELSSRLVESALTSKKLA